MQLSFSNRPKTGNHKPEVSKYTQEMLDPLQVMGKTQQMASAQINLPFFSPCLFAPTNSSATDLASDAIYFIRKDIRVWEITEL